MVTYDYFDDGPQVTDFPWSYTDGSSPLEHTQNVQFQHTVGQIVTAIAGAGLRIEFLHEHDFDYFQRFGSMQTANRQNLPAAPRPAPHPNAVLAARFPARPANVANLTTQANSAAHLA